MDNEFLLMDRLQKIKQVINEYGETNFYISFSGGKDSCVLSQLIDMAIPTNNIPRVYANTGIELNLIIEHVKKLALTDNRIIIIKPEQNIRKMLETNGYPFKSKLHSRIWSIYKNNGIEGSKAVKAYLDLMIPESGIKRYSQHQCPKILEYQFYDQLSFNISDKCCNELKKKPLHKWQKENKKAYTITGIMASEGGVRETAQCLAFKPNKTLKAFQPLAPLSKEWEEWFIEKYNVDICEIYKEPYNFERTGCKGCPFNINIQRELNTLEKYFPNERKQCEIIWKPVYDEYRRIGYRLKE